MASEKRQEGITSVITRLLLAGGVVGPLLFVLLLLIEGATRPGYDALRQAGSELSLGSQGWMQVVNFIISGLLIFGFAVGIHWIIRQGRGAIWGPLLLATVGLALVAAGIFVTDPALGYPPGTPPGPAVHTTWHGALHWYFGGLIFFSCLPAASFVFARRWATESKRMWALYSIVTGVVMVAFFAAFAVASACGGPAGLFQRISISVGMIWVSLFAGRLLYTKAQE